MKTYTTQRIIWGLASAATVIGLAGLPASAIDTHKTNGSNDTAQLQRVIDRGNNEISRRLSTLQSLSSKISASTKLTDSDKASLSSEVSGEIDGLTALKTKLDADTTVADARTDAQAVITEYRVYALVAPKVDFIRVADDQQVAINKLTALIAKFQSRINAAKSAGKNVTALQSALTNMTTQVNNAQPISSGVETSLINLLPSDYNSDHTILGGYRDKLKTAQTDIKAAVSDATSIVQGLKNP